MILTSLLLLVALSNTLSSFVETKSITISWTLPEGINQPGVGAESLAAIWSHLQALQLAASIPKLLGIQKDLQIRLCPPQPYDPLVKEFTVSKLSGYSALYDHECIVAGLKDRVIKGEMNPLWGWKPKQPEPPIEKDPKQPNPQVPGTNGLSIPALILELYRLNKNNKDKDKDNKDKDSKDNQEVWLINSESMNGWLTGPILNQLKPHNSRKISPPQRLMQQINAMAGPGPTDDKRDLKMVPQAIQGALLLILPDYTAWNRNAHTIFNPTWWLTRRIPSDASAICQLAERSINSTRRDPQQLVILVHDPTPLNTECLAHLARIYGESGILSASKVLPKSTSTFQILQFIQKAADVVLDSREKLAQTALLSIGFPQDQVKLLQSFLPYSTWEIVLSLISAAWLASFITAQAYLTRKNYTDPLHSHMLRIALFTIYGLAPIFILNPSRWPEWLSTLLFGIFHSGYGVFVYSVVGFYAVALFITLLAVINETYKSNRFINNDETTPSDDELEAIQLIPK